MSRACKRKGRPLLRELPETWNALRLTPTLAAAAREAFVGAGGLGPGMGLGVKRALGFAHSVAG